MKPNLRIETDRPAGPSLLRLSLAATPIVFLAYAIVLQVARDLSLTSALAGAFANTVPTILFGLAAYRLAGRWLAGRSFWLQVPGHAALGVAYALLCYWLLLIMLGLVHGESVVQFTVAPFPARSSVWQLLQNFTTYGLIAMLATLHGRPEPVALILADPDRAEPEQALSRYFIRSGEEIRPIEVATIVSIAGADDYAEVATLDGRHLVRTTLAEFERQLDPARFARIHRSRIVNLDRIERAEPAGGGRLLLHMEDGETIGTSRSGARLLRDRTI